MHHIVVIAIAAPRLSSLKSEAADLLASPQAPPNVWFLSGSTAGCRGLVARVRAPVSS